MVIVGEEDTPAIETDVMPVDLTPVEPQIKRQNDTDSGGKPVVRRDKPTRFGVGYEYRMRRNGSAVRPDHPGRVQRQLMSPEERADFRDSTQSAQTVEERKRIRTEQHALMQERAKAQGITLPDSPPMRGMGGQRFDRGANPPMRGMGGGPGR
jgi:hypothetical protein